MATARVGVFIKHHLINNLSGGGNEWHLSDLFFYTICRVWSVNTAIVRSTWIVWGNILVAKRIWDARKRTAAHLVQNSETINERNILNWQLLVTPVLAWSTRRLASSHLTADFKYNTYKEGYNRFKPVMWLSSYRRYTSNGHSCRDILDCVRNMLSLLTLFWSE